MLGPAETAGEKADGGTAATSCAPPALPFTTDDVMETKTLLLSVALSLSACHAPRSENPNLWHLF